MANDNKVGCSAGKTILIDPNKFDGHSSFSNVSVPLEDLSISVQLETTKRARTVLTSSEEGKKNTGVSSKEVKVRFIEGSDVAGKRALTTKFTDLTTSFDEGGDGESLGITSIDIDFNSSYAPLITINFIDVRGSSIFQNEENISNGKNKYATFFQLPYPLYKLTIKGYYGMPVSYDLHMTKFNAKFNSQTGNFEITASFIGYTYAMLSDMLLGYLKAIPYTELGAIKYNKIKETQPNLLTLDELMLKISQIDEASKKIKQSDEGVAQLNSGNKKQEDLVAIKIDMLNLGQELDIKNTLDEYRFIIIKKDSNITDAFKKYNDIVTSHVDEYNKDNDIKIELNDFLAKNIPLYEDISISILTQSAYTETLNTRLKNPSSADFDKTKNELRNYVTKYNLATEFQFDVLDLRPLYQKLKATDDAINKELKNLRTSLGKKLRVKIAEILGIDPTVRNIVSVFTASVEVLMSVLFEVSSMAITSDREPRANQLKAKFENNKDSFDMKSESIGSTPDNAPSGPLSQLFYPWPDYRVDDAVDGLVETYLGEPGVLEIPSDVTELRFIDDLLKAFLLSKINDEQAQLALVEEQTNWIPVNPLDTRLFLDTFPYKRIAGNTKSEIISLLLIRTYTSLGISNYKLTPQEIQLIISAECDAILKDIPNDLIVQSLSQLTESDFINATAKNQGEIFPVSKSLNLSGLEYYYYNFIFGIPAPFTGYNTSSYNDAKDIHILPINNVFSGDFDILDTNSKAEDGTLFLTNYRTTADGFTVPKPKDGGTYIKMIKPADYDGTSAKQLPITQTVDTVIELEKLKKEQREFNNDPSGSGLNIFGGKYGIQEFRILNFGEAGLEKAPFMCMFYDNANFDDNTYNYSNGVGLRRGKDATTKYDITISGKTKDKFIIADNQWFGADGTDKLLSVISGDDAIHKSYGKNRLLLSDFIVNKSQDITYPFVNFYVEFSGVDDGNFFWNNDLDLAPVSLFGSRFYHEQQDDYSKALLFLHTFPWRGLVFSDDDMGFIKSAFSDDTIFRRNEILNTFGSRAGFVSVPRLWAAFIGAMLWRADTSPRVMKSGTNKQESGGSGPNDPILFENSTESFIPTFGTSSNIPSRTQYLTSEYDGDFPAAPMVFATRVIATCLNRVGCGYKDLDALLLQLPDQAKEEFKEVFYSFVASDNGGISDWDRVRSSLQVFNGNGVAWKTAWNNVMSTGLTTIGDEKALTTNVMLSNYNASTDGKPVFENYIIFSPNLGESDFDYNYILEIKDNSQASKILMNLVSEELIIANMSYLPWQNPNEAKDITNNPNQQPRAGVFITKEDMQIVIDTAIAKLKPVEGPTAQDKKKEREQEIFGTDNENLIKLQLYRTCKNIYDKWIGGTTDISRIIFRDGDMGRNGIDSELAKKDGRSSNDLRLIDSFRFVNRSFKDIGDTMVINPTPVGEFLRNNPNSSFYDSVTSLLSSNNFDFIALPTYINYGDPQTLESMFEPMSTNESFNQGAVGPAFVCVYVGQTSKHLDFKDSEYTNDGVTFRCDSDGNLLPSPAKDYFNSAEPYENKVPVFAVNYSQQNQNIFKDITLDQSEFSETAESLQIVDEIANKGAENRKTFGGQNMYNVYSVRSYKTEVEMMGNAMIQPMMYFQLNNIPMFHGAYMITHVKHSIKPNAMSTHFTGVRIRNVETPLMDFTEMFMSLLDSIEVSNTAESSIPFGTTSVSGTFPPIVSTIIDNGGLNGNIAGFMSKIGELPSGIANTISDTKELLTESIQPLKDMLTEWVTWMKSQGFVGTKGVYAHLNSAYRSYQQQEEIKKKRGSNAAKPGTSNHGWGIAIDFQFYKKNGDIIFNYDSKGKPNVGEGYNLAINESLVWLLKNSYRFGWIIPESLRDDTGLEEFWHFEYHGKSAACILAKRPTIKTLKAIDTSLPYVASVSNPKNANYANCDYKSIKGLDGTTDTVATANPIIGVQHPSQADIDFYKNILTNLGAPHSNENLKFFYAWRQAEGGKAAWNPFNTTKKVDGATKYNNAPVRNYPTKETGIKATSDTLIASYYKKIVKGLREDIGAANLAAITDELKTWGTGNGIARVLHGNLVNPPSIPTTTTKTV